MIKIHSFHAEPEPLARFIETARALRGDDPQWVPEFKAEVEAAFSPRSLFLSHGELRGFLAEEGGRPVARCAAIINRQLTEDGAPLGQIGFYECREDPETSRAILETAQAWLQERGVRRVVGPMNFSIWHDYRFMTRGFGTDPFLGEPRNPEFYPEQWTASGFAPRARYFSWDLTEEHLRGMLAYARHAADPAGMAAAGLRHAPLEMNHFDQQLESVHRLLVDAFRGNAAFSPISLEEFRGIFGGVKPLLIPQLVPLVWTARQEAVGFGYLFPDFAEAVRKMNGETGLLARARFLMAKGRPDRLIFHTVAIREDHRKKGMVETVLADLLGFALSNGFTRGVGALAKEGPTMYSKTGAPSREYTLFSRAL